MTREEYDESGKVKLRSMIYEFFAMDQLIELYKLSIDLSADNNIKKDELCRMLTEWKIPYEPIGPGTNRYAALINGVIFKFALDRDGMIDNRREFKYTVDTQPYTIKVYECLPNGLIATCEYVELMTIDDIVNRNIQDRMRKILEELGDRYFIGDIGIDTKNYTNWGYRKNQNRDLVILDFAYIYSTSFKTFRCNCDGRSILSYDENYTSLRCPTCDAIYSFSNIRQKISKKDQENEIGDIREIGYTMHSLSEIQDLDLDFSFRRKEEEKTKKKEKKKKDKSLWL